MRDLSAAKHNPILMNIQQIHSILIFHFVSPKLSKNLHSLTNYYLLLKWSPPVMLVHSLHGFDNVHNLDFQPWC